MLLVSCMKYTLSHPWGVVKSPTMQWGFDSRFCPRDAIWHDDLSNSPHTLGVGHENWQVHNLQQVKFKGFSPQSPRATKNGSIFSVVGDRFFRWKFWTPSAGSPALNLKPSMILFPGPKYFDRGNENKGSTFLWQNLKLLLYQIQNCKRATLLHITISTSTLKN